MLYFFFGYEETLNLLLKESGVHIAFGRAPTNENGRLRSFDVELHAQPHIVIHKTPRRKQIDLSKF